MKTTMQGKICLVTGSTSGIGKETAVGLAELGATVVVIARDRIRGQALLSEITQRTGNRDLTLLLADLASQSSIHDAAAEFKSRFAALHVLVNQAGLVMPKLVLTPDGIETTFAVNHLAYFLLTNLLLDKLQAGSPSRIINGTGGIYQAGDIYFDDFNGAKKNYSWFRALAQSKLANVLFTYELARRQKGTGVTVNCFHPGGVKTGLGQEMPGLVGLLLKLARPFWATPAKGAEPVIWLASAPELAEVSGQYFDKTKRVTTGGKTKDLELAKRLWDLSAELTRLEAK